MSKNATYATVATWALLFLALVGIWLYPATAFAQEAPPATPVSEGTPMGDFMTMLIKIVFSAAGIVATYLATKAIGYFEKKTKIDIPAATEKTIFEWADKGVGYAHEKSHQLAQSAGRKMSGLEKLNIAMQFVNDLVEKNGYDKMAEERLRKYIESKLGEKRLESGGLPPNPV